VFAQIEGFKLHVVHNLRPFVNRIRYTPEVASKPDRLEKDLTNAKILAGLLEDEAVALRKTRFHKGTAKDPAIEGVEGENGIGERKEDVSMTDGQVDEDDDDDEPQERGSDAVDRRIEKVIAEARDQGVVDVNDEKVLQSMKVCLIRFVSFQCHLSVIHCRRWSRSTCILLTCELRSTHVTTVPL